MVLSKPFDSRAPIRSALVQQGADGFERREFRRIASQKGRKWYDLMSGEPNGLRRLGSRFSKKKTVDEMRDSSKASSPDATLLSSLNGFQLFFIVLGHTVGAGIFILIGRTVAKDAGPAALFSLSLAALLAFLSALTFSELCSVYPLSGGAFNYASAIFGEFTAWMTISVIAGSILASGGALARFWSQQLAVLMGKDSLRISAGSLELDPVACGITIFAILLVAYSTKLVSLINIVLKSILLGIIVVVLIRAFPKAESKNWEEFFPYGADGAFTGTASVFYAFTGYDAACYLAEEATHPERDIPRYTLLALGLVSILYFLMASALTLGVDYTEISKVAPFYFFFKDKGNDWEAYFVSTGALVAVGTVILVSLLVNTRQLLAMARYRLLPWWLAKIDPRTSTPWRLTLIFGAIKCFLALTTSAPQLAKYRSGGVLFVLAVVASALLWRRYVKDDELYSHYWVGPGVRLFLIVLISMIFGGLYKEGSAPYWVWILLTSFWVLVTLSFYRLPEVQLDHNFRVPLAPLVSSSVIFGACFFLWQLGSETVIRSFLFMAASALIYLIYGVHVAERHDVAVKMYKHKLELGADAPWDDPDHILDDEERRRIQNQVRTRDNLS